jgi:hypothetical protein
MVKQNLLPIKISSSIKSKQMMSLLRSGGHSEKSMDMVGVTGMVNQMMSCMKII